MKRRLSVGLAVLSLLVLTGSKCNSRPTEELTVSSIEMGVDGGGSMMKQKTLVYLGNEVDSATLKVTTKGFKDDTRFRIRDVQPGVEKEFSTNVENEEVAISGRVFMMEADYGDADSVEMLVPEIKVRAGAPWYPGPSGVLENKPLSVALGIGQAVDMLSLPDRSSQFFFTISGTSGKSLEIAFEGRAKVFVTTMEEGFIRDPASRTADFESGGDGSFFPVSFDPAHDHLLISVLTEGVADGNGQWMRMVVAQNLKRVNLRVRLLGQSKDYGSAESTTAKLQEIAERTSARLFRLSGGAMRIGKVEYVVGVFNHREFKDNVVFHPQSIPGAPEAFAWISQNSVHMAQSNWRDGPFYSSRVLAHELLHTRMGMPDEYIEGAPTCGMQGLQRGSPTEVCGHSLMGSLNSTRLCTPADHNPNDLNLLNGGTSMWEMLNDEIDAPIPSDSASPVLFWHENRGEVPLRSLMRLPIEIQRL